MSAVRKYVGMYNCENCGTLFNRREDMAKVGRGIYCTSKCFLEKRYGRMTVDSAAVKNMYCEQNMTLKEIAEALGCEWKRIRKVLVAMGVTLRLAARRRNPNRRSRATYIKMVKWEKGSVVHHLNCIETDDRPENLVVVSRPRHSELHKQLEGLSANLFTAGLITFCHQRGYQMTDKLKTLLGT